MKIKDLLKKLEKLDPNMEIILRNIDRGQIDCECFSLGVINTNSFVFKEENKLKLIISPHIDLHYKESMIKLL